MSVLAAPAPNAARRRLAALALVVVIHLLLVAGLLLVAQQRVRTAVEQTVMMLVPVPADRPAPIPARQRTAKRAVRTHPIASAPVPPSPVKPPPKTLALDIPFDLTKAPTAPAAPAAIASADTASSGQTYGPVLGGRTAPGGGTLYAAEWEVEPTDAELATYMPAHVEPGSYGIVACRTIARFRVEDCTELDESPSGSGMARAVRLASWQFRIRPPRVDGRALVGAWVSVRIVITPRGIEVPGRHGP